MKETDLFEPVKAWLEDKGYDVYTEVISHSAGGRADIVAVSGPAVAVVEMKRSLTLDLLAQAARWKLYSNYIYIAVPQGKNRRVSNYVKKILRREGIGLLEVVFPDKTWYQRQPYVQNTERCRFHRRIDDHLRESLTEKHKELPGGHAGGGYITEYSQTIDRVRDYLKYDARGEWAALNDILDHCETHYASPKSSLAAALKKWECDWCESQIINGRLHFRIKPKEESET